MFLGDKYNVWTSIKDKDKNLLKLLARTVYTEAA